MISSHRLCLAFATASLLLAGCAADSTEEAAPTEDELRVKPKGVDDGSGRVIVEGISGVAKVDVTLSEPRARGSSDAPIDFVMGVPTVPVTNSFLSTQGGVTASVSGRVDANRGQTATVKLAGLKINLGSDRALGLDGSSSLEFERSRSGPKDMDLSVDPRPNVDTSHAVLVNPTQKVLLRWGIFDGQSFTTAAGGRTSTFNVQAVAGRMRAKISHAVRELPNGCTIMRDEISVGGGGRSMTFPATVTKTIGVNPEVVALESRAADGGKMSYRLPCMKYDLDLPVGSLGGAAREIKLGRIDVDHVDVTTPTGTVEAREGTYRIDNDGMFADQKFKTGTGVDVPPGTYHIVVSYYANSGSKEFTQTVTVP